MHAPGEPETPGEPGAYGGLPWPLLPTTARATCCSRPGPSSPAPSSRRPFAGDCLADIAVLTCPVSILLGPGSFLPMRRATIGADSQSTWPGAAPVSTNSPGGCTKQATSPLPGTERGAG